MNKIAIVLACLACSGCGKRVQASVRGVRSSTEPRQNEQGQALTSLLGLLASHPTAAFNPMKAGARSPMSHPAMPARRVPLMSTATGELSNEELKKSLDARIEELTLEHPDTLSTKFKYALSLKASGDLEGAKKELMESIEVYKKTQGYDAPGVLTSKDELAELLRETGDAAQADEIVEEVTKLRSRRQKDGRRGAEYWSKIDKYNRIIPLIKKQMQSTYIILTISHEGMSVQLQENLRKRMPKETLVKVVKNSLVKRCAREFPAFVGIDAENSPLPTYGNMWIFCTEDSFKPTLEAIEEWQKEFNKKEDHPILGGAFDGEVYDLKGVQAISKLPGRRELMASVAVGIKAIPTKIGRGIKLVPTKIARGLHRAGPVTIAKGVKLATEKGEEKGAAKLGDI
mmetsp:Transcript_101656/g.185518  ORF Transcript_101656/g.185518 Transcript_101656/m.185518 type:complete len:400 (-) Transcript_101656:69-1268(-)